jgi:hypothetical protein
MRMRIGNLLLLALPLVSLAELGAHRHYRHSAPTQEDWQRLGPEVAAMQRRGDWVTVEPHWADPLLRQQLGDNALPIDILARADDETLARVLEVSFGDAKGKHFEGWPERERRSSGPFLIRALDNPHPETARMRLIDRVTPEWLSMTEGSAGDPLVCTFTSNARATAGNLGGDPTFGPRRFACPSGEPYLVTVTTIDDELFAPRRCIWAHPSPRGPITLRFRNVWLGIKLVGHAGLPWLLARDGAGTPIHLTAEFEGSPIGQVVVEDTQGWMRFEWSTESHRDQRGDLELVVSSAEPRNRRFCFTLESR